MLKKIKYLIFIAIIFLVSFSILSIKDKKVFAQTTPPTIILAGNSAGTPEVQLLGTGTSSTPSQLTVHARVTSMGSYTTFKTGARTLNMSGGVIGYGVTNNGITATSYTIADAGSNFAGTSAFSPSTICGTSYQVQAIVEIGGTSNLGTGTIIATSTLLSYGACNGVSTSPATSITATSAQLNGNLSYTHGLSTTYGFSGSFGSVTSGTSNSAIGNYGTTVTGLTCGTTYTFYATASSTSGSSTGSPLSFVTPNCSPPPTIGVTGCSGGNGSVYISYIGAGTSTAVGLCRNLISYGGYASSTARIGSGVLDSSGSPVVYGMTLANSATGTALGFSQNTYSLFSTSISCGNTYRNVGFALNLSGAAIASTTSSFNGCNSVTTGGATSISPTSEIIYGTLGYDAGLNTSYGFSGSFGSTVTVGSTSTTTILPFNTTLTGLTCGTSYTYQAFASGGGASSTGVTSSFTITCPTPPVVTTGTSSSITYTSATLGGNLTTVGSASTTATVGFQYGLTTAYGATSTIGTSTGGIFTKSATGLQMCTTYHYRAFATNYYTSFGSDSTFATSCPIPPTVTTNNAVGITSNSATLLGSITFIGSYSSSASSVGFQYGLTTAYGSSISNSGSYGVGNFSITSAASFSCGTTYHYRAFAINGNTGYGADKTFRTDNCIGTNGNVTGYAWGSHIGWISLNCAQGLPSGNVCSSSQYSVNVTPNFTTHIGTFSGYAWNPSTYGWITFNPSETSLCGAPATVDLSTGNPTSGYVSGYAKILSATTTSGCISLRGTASSTAYGVYYTPTITPYNLSASLTASSTAHLGGTNPDFINFPSANLNLATSTLYLTVNGATSTTLTSVGGAVSIVWTATNMAPTNCTASGDWSGPKSSGGGSDLITISPNTGTSTITKTYTLGSCVSILGNTIPSQSVTVLILPSSSSVLKFKANGAGDNVPLNVTTGDAVNLTWELQNITHGTCIGTSTTDIGPLSGWNNTYKAPLSSDPSVGASPVTFSEIIIATSSRSYTMTCTGSSTISKTVNIITTDQILPASVTLTVNGATSTSLSSSGGNVTLQWITSNLDSTGCTATSSDGLWSGPKSSAGGSDIISIPSNFGVSALVKTYTLSGCKGSGVTIPALTVKVFVSSQNTSNLNFTADGQSTLHIVPGESVTLSWQEQNITHGSCSGISSGSFSGWSSNSKYPLITDPSVGTSTVTTYEIVGADGSITSNRTYTLTCTAPTTISKTVSIITDLVCSGTACNNGRSSSNLNLTVNGDTSASLGSSGGSINLVWTTSNLTPFSCSATSSDSLWTGSKSSAGGSDIISIPANTSTTTTITNTYTLSGCTNIITGAPVPSQSVTVTVAPTGAPAIISFTANGVNSGSTLTMTSGSLLTLSWQVQNVGKDKCSGTSSGSFIGWNSTIKEPSTNVTTAQTFYDYLGADGSVTTSRTYTLSCVGVSGSKTVTIDIVPPIVNTTCVGTTCGGGVIPPALKATTRPSWMEI